MEKTALEIEMSIFVSVWCCMCVRLNTNQIIFRFSVRNDGRAKI